MNPDEGAIRRTVMVPARLERAFRVFTEEMAGWWPRAYTWSGDELARVVIEPGPGGRWYERRSHGGEESDWGAVLEWDPPHRVALSWAIRPDRTPEPDTSRTSEVDVRFFEEGDATRLELTHDAFERHGAGADDYRRGMDSPDGWTMILDRFVKAVA